MPNKVLLASHGTPGAQAAEHALFNMQLANTEVVHLYVIPDFWEHMLGDDWLNNQITQERFGNYLESELMHEAKITINRVGTAFKKRNITCNNLLLYGDPEQSLLDTCEKYDFKFIVTGSPRPRFLTGLQSRMTTHALIKTLTTSHLQIPYPNTKH